MAFNVKKSYRFALLTVIPAVLTSLILSASPANAQAAGPDKGERLFLRCRTCHEVAAGKPNKVGPNLHGFWGRGAAKVEGFKYSDALRASGVVWDEKSLDTWLTHPTTLVPGTTMAFVGLPEKADRDALIDYLRRATN